MSDQAVRIAALDTTRNILLQAPAGSGKTTVLAQRFLSALASVQQPEQVLAVTFTRKAAAEMRERVLLALEGRLPANQADRDVWQTLSNQVVAHARQCGWVLEELPARLRIQTIDSMAHEIARAMPLLGRMYASLHVVDDARPLYLEAARETLRYGDVQVEHRAATDLLLRRLDNDWNRAEALLAELLSSRSRWQPLLLAHAPEELATRVSASLRRIVGDILQQAVRSLTPALLAEGAALATASAQHRRDAEPDGTGIWRVWLDPTASLTTDPEQLPAWQAISQLVLTTEGKPRAQITVKQGFPREEKLLKQRWLKWMAELQQHSSTISLLRGIETLPPLAMDESEREALAALAQLMLLAAMHLKLVFRERGLVDHGEVAAVARQAMHDLQGPTEQSIRQTLRVRHLLVDEFQDTSPEQLDLIRDLMVGWDSSEARSLFLVGDPMQSIYLFRNSEVGLFLQTRTRGLGEMALESMQLQRNFRSEPRLVDWANTAFQGIFPVTENVRSSAVTFLPAEAARRATVDNAASITVWAQPSALPDDEAQAIAREIVLLRRQQPTCSVAVLVQTRALAAPVLRALRDAHIVTQGVDLATLADRTVVRDLVALGQALCDGGNRAAWLAVLRAPHCGLALTDLLLLCEAAGTLPLVEYLDDPPLAVTLSVDGRQRLARIGGPLVHAWRSRGSWDLATTIERLWRDLGGPAACHNTGDRDAARQYLLALRQLQETRGNVDGAELQQLAERLRDRSEVSGEYPVEVLTIHHAKGLEWDVVFVPGLGKQARADMPPLLRWLQLPAGPGDSDLLLAVHSIGEPNVTDPLARYIARLQSERQANERLRLLYVAVTRARQHIYLSGYAPWRATDNAAVPAKRSLLQLLWPAVRQYYSDGIADAAAEQESDEEAAATAAVQAAAWHRLPTDFQRAVTDTVPVVQSLTKGTVDAATVPEFSWVGPLARAMGTVMHAEFEWLATAGVTPVPDLETRVAPCAARLRELGIANDQAQHSAAHIVRQLRSLASDEHLRWMFNPEHRQAYSELRLSGIVAGELRNVIIDRSFVDEQGTRWIIDFKTSMHSGGGLEEFLAREMLRYTPQLRLYQTLCAELGPEPVRAALYFPWLGALRSFEAAVVS
jgi:ATP-dependent helicase/nuclease subunit A